MKIFIEKSKTDIYRNGNWIYIARGNSELCPVATLQRYLNMAKINENSEEFIFSSGGASAAANAGVNDRLFKNHGRRRSESAKDGYIEDNIETLLTVSRMLGL